MENEEVTPIATPKPEDDNENEENHYSNLDEFKDEADAEDIPTKDNKDDDKIKDDNEDVEMNNASNEQAN